VPPILIIGTQKTAILLLALPLLMPRKRLELHITKKTASKVLQRVTWIRPLESWVEQIPVNKEVIPQFQKINH
jgi:hypothetical protein